MEPTGETTTGAVGSEGSNPSLAIPPTEAATENPNESFRLELQEALQTVRHWQSQAMQGAGFLVTGNVLLLAYGFAQRQAAILFVASATPMIIVFIVVLSIIFATPVMAVAVNFERKLLESENGLAVTYARRLGLTNSLKRPFIRPVPIALYLLTIGEISLAVICLTVAHYPLF